MTDNHPNKQQILSLLPGCNQLSRQRIIFILSSLRLGGSENQAILLATHLRDVQNMDVEIWGFGQPERVSMYCEQLGIPWRSIPKPRVTSRRFIIPDLIRFTRTLYRAHPAILMPCTLASNLACGLAWRFSGARLCVWNQKDEGKGIRPGRLLERFAIWLTPRFISNSNVGAEVVIKLGAPSQAVRVIHNGLIFRPPQANRATWRTRLGADDCLLICMVANLSPYKDHATLLQAWQLFLEHYPEPTARLLLAGRQDAAFPELKKLTIKLGIEDRVDFLGPVDDISGLLGAIDLGVYSSPSEGLPNAVIETMAAGLPIIATDIPGIREAIGDDSEIQLAPANNPEVLATRLLTLANDPKQRTILGERNHQRALEQFHPDRMFSQTVEFLCQSMSRL